MLFGSGRKRKGNWHDECSCRFISSCRTANPDTVILDDRRGTGAMLLFIATEAFLFIILFFAYFYLAKGGWRWLAEEPPSLHYAIPNIVILLVSAAIVFWGSKQVGRANYGRGRLALGGAIVLGAGFLVLEAFDYSERLVRLQPQTDTYGSIYYTILGFHSAHTDLGPPDAALCPDSAQLRTDSRAPYRPYYNVALYWYFVLIVWLFVAAFLYVAPNVR